MRIGYKLILGYVLIAALSGVTMYLANRSYYKINRMFEELSSDSVLEIEVLEELKLAALRIIPSTSKFALIEAESINNSNGSTQAATERDLISSGVENYNNALAKYEPLVDQNSPELEYRREIKKYGADLIRISAELVNNKRHGTAGAEVLEKKKEFERAEEKFMKGKHSAGSWPKFFGSLTKTAKSRWWIQSRKFCKKNNRKFIESLNHNPPRR
jgi:hypothetical protein